MRPYILLILLLTPFWEIYSQEGHDVIIESKNIEYDVKSLKRTVITFDYKLKYTTNRRPTQNHIYIDLHSNDRLKNFYAIVKDANGNKLIDYRKNDLKESSGYGNYTLYNDNKRFSLDVPQFTPPYTCEYEYEIIREGFLGTVWQPIEKYDVLIHSATFTLHTPLDVAYKYRSKNMDIEPGITQDNDTKTARWKLENIPPYDGESRDPSMTENIPLLFITPEKFIYHDVYGKSGSWHSYGKWIYNLQKDRQHLSSATVNHIKKITAHTNDTIEKIKTVYKYLQENTRYVSIQKGIGGLQPYPASKVEEYKYGDCKALCNYMRALLQAVDVEAIYTEIGNGNNLKVLWDDFPSVYQTNHVILMVPLAKDTLWLECTSDKAPFGFIGVDNADRKAIAIKASGGEVVHTPKYPFEKNQQMFNGSIKVFEDGSMKGNGEYKSTGLAMEDFLYIKHMKGGFLKNMFRNVVTPIPIDHVEHIEITESSDLFPHIKLSIQTQDNHFSSVSNRFMSFNPFYFEKHEGVSSLNLEREYDILLPYGFGLTDSIKIEVPSSFQVEYLPQQDTIKSDFGKYYTNIIHKEDHLLLVRHYEEYEGRYAKEKIKGLVTFNALIEQFESQNIILKRKEEE